MVSHDSQGESTMTKRREFIKIDRDKLDQIATEMGEGDRQETVLNRLSMALDESDAGDQPEITCVHSADLREMLTELVMWRDADNAVDRIIDKGDETYSEIKEDVIGVGIYYLLSQILLYAGACASIYVAIKVGTGL